MNFGENGPAKIITRSDLKASMQSYENVSLPHCCVMFPSVRIRLILLPFRSLPSS
jgi:hypothetical protein